MTPKDTSALSPRWGSTTKMVIALTAIAILAGLMIQFNNIIPPLMMVIILAYLLYPLANFFSIKLHLGWKWAVNIVFLIIVIVVFGTLTLGGVGLIQQVQSMVILAQESLANLPEIINSMSHKTYTLLGIFTIDFSALDLSAFSEQILGAIEPLLGRTGTVLSAIAGGAFNLLGWTVFVLLVAYFVLIETGGLQSRILNINIPGYNKDIERMTKELGHIWNAFLRGQIIIMVLAALVYTVALNVLGVKYAIGLALFAGAARFLPYFGPLILWIILALVTYFQDVTPYQFTPFTYTLTVVISAWIIDGIIDNAVMPRIMADALEVHPAAVLVAAIIAFELLGILGMIIAAPMLATLKLFSQYIFNKMFDRNPWEDIKEYPSPPHIRAQIKNFFMRFMPASQNRKK